VKIFAWQWCARIQLSGGYVGDIGYILRLIVIPAFNETKEEAEETKIYQANLF
jgi:hypothetical protein